MLAVIFAGGRASLRGLSCCEIPQFTSESRIETHPTQSLPRERNKRITGIVFMIAHPT